MLSLGELTVRDASIYFNCTHDDFRVMWYSLSKMKNSSTQN